MRNFVLTLTMGLVLGLVGCSPEPGSTESPIPIEDASTSAARVSSEPSADNKPTTFDDYVGRTYDDVFAELQEYGIRITKTEEESTESAGEVLAQDPAGGSNFDTNIELTVAVRPAGVPDVMDSSFGKGKADLEKLGFTVIEEPIIDDTKNDGEIISQEPAPGTENAGAVTLTVARQPVIYGLADIQYLEPENYVSGYRFEIEGTFKADGKVYPRGSSIKFSDIEPAILEFNLSRAFLSLDGTIALSETSPGGAEAQVDITGDGRELFSEKVSFGANKTLPIQFSVSDVLRLKVRIAPTDPNAEVILGDWEVRGFEASLDEAEEGEEEEEEEE